MVDIIVIDYDIAYMFRMIGIIFRNTTLSHVGLSPYALRLQI